MKQYEQVYDTMNFRLHYTDKRDQNVQTNQVEVSVGVKQSPKKQEVKKVVEKKLPKRPPGYYLRKFRIAGFVVFYTLLFPKYTKMIKQLRKKYFFSEIVSKNQMSKETNEYLKTLQTLKLNFIYKQKQRQKRRQKQGAYTLDFEETNEKGITKKYSINVSSISEIVKILLDGIK